MSDLSARYPAPRAVIVVSPHWETDLPVVGVSPKLETIHDFGGFDLRLFQMPMCRWCRSPSSITADLGMHFASDRRLRRSHERGI